MSKDGGKTEILPEEWMIRPCNIYEDEYKDCKSIKARFHQYFIFGELSDCSSWKEDWKSCDKWCIDKDTDAYKSIIENEKKRRRERLAPHYQNNVWKKREKPPENWNAPLPEWMQKKVENSYLQYKSQEEKGTPTAAETICTIM